MSNLGECEVEWVLLSSPTFDQKNRVGSTNQRIADTLDWAEKWTTKKWKKSNSILFFETRRKKIFFSNQLIFKSRYISWPDRHTNQFTGLSDKQRWKEIKHKLKRTLRDSISNILLEQLLQTRQMELFIMQRENQMVLHALSR